jgi:hypothetical protein
MGKSRGSVFGWRVCGSGDERRTLANSGDEPEFANSGDEQRTSDGEQGDLERGASSGRGEWRESSAALL